MKITAKYDDGIGNTTCEGTHEDLGLCYVSKFIIDKKEIISIFPQGYGDASARMQKAKEDLHKNGWIDLEIVE